MDWRERCRKFAARPEPVLVRGETGVGKEGVARWLADGRRGPMVAVNCGAIPPTLLEAELFGVAPGAFTGAHPSEGLVRAAADGTLFLDEVGEMPLAVQAALLRFLDSGEYRSVGSQRTRTATTRVVAATNRDLRAEVAAGRFRQDLYYRLAVLEIEVPPLRERLDELETLVAGLAPRLTVSRSAIDRMHRHPWPGNVRELRNVLIRAEISLAARGGDEVEPEDLDFQAFSPPVASMTMRSAKRDMAERAVEAAGGNKRLAARQLGVSPTTLGAYLKL